MDYQSFKTCRHEVCSTWEGLLTSETYQKRAKSVFASEMLEDEEKLRQSSGHGNAKEVCHLLSIGVAQKAGMHGWTPLHLAAGRAGHTDAVQLLLNAGADTNAIDDRNNTPMHMAMFSGHSGVVQLLLNSGAELSFNTRIPLLTAARMGHKDMVQILLTAGVDPNTGSLGGITPLYWAEKYGQKDVMKLLLEWGAKPT